MQGPSLPSDPPLVDESLSEFSGGAVNSLFQTAMVNSDSEAVAAPTGGGTTKVVGGGPGVFEEEKEHSGQKFQQQAIGNMDLHKNYRGRRSGGGGGSEGDGDSAGGDTDSAEYYGCCLRLLPRFVRRCFCRRLQDGDDMSFNSRISVNAPLKRNRSFIFTLLIVVFGIGASAGFLALGILGAHNDLDSRFEQQAKEFVNAVVATVKDYEVSALWIHESCRSSADHVESHHGEASICSRLDFFELYQHLTHGGIHFKSVQYIPWISHEERENLEEESREFYKQFYPYLDYRGFTAFDYAHDHSSNQDEFSPGYSLSSNCMVEDDQEYIIPQTNKTSYLPVHYIAPVAGNEASIDLDIKSSGERRKALEKAIETGRPVITARLRCLDGEVDHDDEEHHHHEGHPQQVDVGYDVILIHPGIRFTSSPFETGSTQSDNDHNHGRGRRLGGLDDDLLSFGAGETLSSNLISFSAISFSIANLLEQSTRDRTGHLSVYIYDEADSKVMIRRISPGWESLAVA